METEDMPLTLDELNRMLQEATADRNRTVRDADDIFAREVEYIQTMAQEQFQQCVRVEVDGEQRAQERRGEEESTPAPRHSNDTGNTGYTGSLCHHCGSPQMVRSAACEKCLNCGESSGCS